MPFKGVGVEGFGNNLSPPFLFGGVYVDVRLHFSMGFGGSMDSSSAIRELIEIGRCLVFLVSVLIGLTFFGLFGKRWFF